MPITYKIDPQSGLLQVTWSGVVTLQELAEHWDRLLKDATFPGVAHALTDLRASTFAFDGAAFWRTIDDHYRDAISLKTFKVAILVANQDQEKYAGIWKTLVPKTVTVGLFKDPRQALAWLHGDPDAAPTE